MRGVTGYNETLAQSVSVASLTGFEQTWRLCMTLLITFVIMFTILGNFVTLVAIFKLKTLKKSISNLFIASLAAADLIVGGFVMTFMMIYTVANSNVWHFGPVFCDIWQVLDMSSCTTSLYSILAITFDRWWHLEKPLRVFKRRRAFANKILILIWSLPIFVWLPTFVGIRLNQSSAPANYTCSVLWRPKLVVPLLAVPVLYIPVILLIVLFMRISFVIRTHLNFLSIHSNRNTKRDRDTANRSHFLLESSIQGGGMSELDVPRKKLSLSANYNRSPEEESKLLACKRRLSYDSICKQDSKENSTAMASQSTITASTTRNQSRLTREQKIARYHSTSSSSLNSSIDRKMGLAGSPVIVAKLPTLQELTSSSQSSGVHLKPNRARTENSRSMSYLETTSAIVEASSNEFSSHHDPIEPLNPGSPPSFTLRLRTLKPSRTISEFRDACIADRRVHKTISCDENLSCGRIPTLEKVNNAVDDDFADINYYAFPSKSKENAMPNINLSSSDETEENILRALTAPKKIDTLERKISLRIVATKVPLGLRRSHSQDDETFCSPFVRNKDESINSPRRHPPILRKISFDQSSFTCSSPTKKKLSFDFSQSDLNKNEALHKQTNRHGKSPLAMERRLSQEESLLSRRSSALSFSSIFAMFSSKRDSNASDTAYVFTKGRLKTQENANFINRSKTEVQIQVEGKPHPQSQCVSGRRRSQQKRFSIISLRNNVIDPLKRGSMGLFTDFFPHSGKNGSFAQQVRAGKAVGLILILFLACWLPFLILWPLRTYCEDCVSDTVYSLAMWANYLNSTINPILYTLCSPRFRRALREHWNCRKCSRSQCSRSPFNSPHPARKKLTPAPRKPLLIPVVQKADLQLKCHDV